MLHSTTIPSKPTPPTPHLEDPFLNINPSHEDTLNLQALIGCDFQPHTNIKPKTTFENIQKRPHIELLNIKQNAKLETIQETNSEISFIKKEVLSTHNFNSSVNNTNNGLVSMLEERNFYSKATSLLRNLNANNENVSVDENGNGNYTNKSVSMFKDIEMLFGEKNSNRNVNKSEVLTHKDYDNDKCVSSRTTPGQFNTFITKDKSCSNICCVCTLKSKND